MYTIELIRGAPARAWKDFPLEPSSPTATQKLEEKHDT